MVINNNKRNKKKNNNSRIIISRCKEHIGVMMCGSYFGSTKDSSIIIRGPLMNVEKQWNRNPATLPLAFIFIINVTFGI